jgi:hypothetical protein
MLSCMLRNGTAPHNVGAARRKVPVAGAGQETQMVWWRDGGQTAASILRNLLSTFHRNKRRIVSYCGWYKYTH